MRFSMKIAICMLALLSVLFGAGGSLLIAKSFGDSLEREKDTAFEMYCTAWGTVQMVSGMNPYLQLEELADTVRLMFEQNRSDWATLRFSTEEKVLYRSETAFLQFPDTGALTAGNCVIQIAGDDAGGRYLFLSGGAVMGEDMLYLQIAYDISALYTMRQGQLRTFLQIFSLLAILCAILSYAAARLLTLPLVSLSRVSRAIAGGKFSSRIRLRSLDDIGQVAQDFNTMAARMEKTVVELRGAVKRQERFVGSFAHEMKTPMTALIGYAELLRSGTLTQEEQTEAAGYIYSEGKRLENLSKKLLELLVLKQKDIPLTPICPAALVEELTERLKPLYAAKGIVISCQCEDGACYLEPDLVWSLLLNLADNAQKAMDCGGHIAFCLEMLKDGCRVQVLDNGRGIPPEALAHLTEAFYRVDKARSREQGGFGLGLSLCQEIASLHHGTIRLENRPEGGVCATVELRGGRA